MGTDAADVLSLQCPECRALLRMRSADAGDEPFPCPDCGCALRVARLDDGTDSGLLLLEAVAGAESGEQAPVLRTARPKRRRRKPTTVGSEKDSRPAADDVAGRTRVGSRERFAALQRVAAWAGRWKRPTSAQLTWMVAAMLAIGLLLLYVPAGDEVRAVALNQDGVPAGRAGGDSTPPGAVAGGPPAGSAAGTAAGDDVPDVAGAAERRENGDDELAAIPPDEIRNPPEEGDLPVGDAPPGEPAKPEPGVVDELPVEVPAEVARRHPVVAPRPEVPDVPPVDLRMALAIRLQSYRMTEPAAAGVLLRELEEMTGVPFREERRDGQTDDWKQRRVLISMEDVTVGELLERVAELAGVEARIDGNTVQLIPPVVRDGEAPAALPVKNAGDETPTSREMD